MKFGNEKFKDLFEFQSKSKVQAKEGLLKGKYPFYTSSNILSKYINEFNYKGESLIFGTGGKASVHFAENEFSTSTDCLISQPIDENRTSTLYCYYFLKSNMAILENGFHGAGLKHISKSYISDIKIPLPTLADQIRIAEILSQAEALIAQRKESIGLLDAYLKSTFLEMFGDPVRNEKGFPIRKLNEFYITAKEGTKCGPFGSALKKNEYKSNGIPVWIMDNISINGNFIEENSLWISETKFNELKSYSVINNDVIISRAGTVGKMCVVKTNHKLSIISTNLIRVRFGEKLLPIHFVSLMKYSNERVAKLRTGAEGTFTHMNTGILDGIIFPYPPLYLQTQFATIVEKVEALKSEYQESLLELQNMYGVLSQKAFKGELVESVEVV